jgi:PadR family transcriptional regulator AphA
MIPANMTTRNIAGESTGARAEPALPVTTFAVLGQIARAPATGYEVQARLRRTAALFWHCSYSQIYAELRRLAGLGYVSEERVAQERRPNKRVYTITESGREALVAWLERPWGLAQVRDESLVKLMLADALPAGRVADELKRLKAQHEERRREFEAELAVLPPDAGPFVRYALWKGVRAQAAFADWCQAVADDLSGPGG